jgi:hypothetical protein
MRAIKIVQQVLTPILGFVHSKRVDAVLWGIRSLIYGRRLSLTAIGRAARGTAYTKHYIKRADRLLGNKKLHKEILLYFHATAMWIIRGKRRPLILIDWTRLEPRHVILAAAIPVDGRALTVYSEVHPLAKLGKPGVQKRFLKKLRQLLPTDCRPIVVTDAGFMNPWFREIQSMGWDFVGRLRGKRYMRPAESRGRWVYLKSLFSKALLRAQDLGVWSITPKNPFDARVIIGRRPKKAGIIIGQNHQRKAKKRATEPWVLATSLERTSAAKIEGFYGTRMQIEETFRDTKNHRFGWSFRHAMSRSPERIQVLLLLATLGMLAVTLLGQSAETACLHYRYQGNTIRKHRVVSLFVLGLGVLHRGDDRLFGPRELEASALNIRGKIKCLP